MKKTKHHQIRQQIAKEAARLMYEEAVGEYFTAKRIAAQRLFGKKGGRTLRHRPMDLPSNGEIRDALLALSSMMEGDARTERLFAMRALALETMEALRPFTPRLIGSVSTGHVRRGSDIDLHVFTEDIEQLEEHIHQLNWIYEIREVTIRKGNTFKDYQHIYVQNVFPIELSIYTPHELRIVQLSSTDGKPIVRVKSETLKQMILDEHPEPWEEYLETKKIPGLQKYEDEAELSTLAEMELEPEEEQDDDWIHSDKKIPIIIITKIVTPHKTHQNSCFL